MNSAVTSMLGRYQCSTTQDYENALKEIMQELALLGLWRTKFFEHAAFYGGTALRILHGLDRFSEDLDFSLLNTVNDFDLAPYLSGIKSELNSMGFDVSVEKKTKSAESAIKSAFIKAGTKEHLLRIVVPKELHKRINNRDVLSVRFDLDTDPPLGFHTESRSLLQPIPFSVTAYKIEDLFAGKLHAVLQRKWKSRMKGRDYYDFVWYVARGVPVHLSHLEERMRQSSGWEVDRKMQKADLIKLLQDRIEALDLEAVKNEVLPFVRDRASLNLWSKEFFESVLLRLQVV